jgi:hypothetical protein
LHNGNSPRTRLRDYPYNSTRFNCRTGIVAEPNRLRLRHGSPHFFHGVFMTLSS